MAADRKHIALGDLMMLAATMIFGAMTIFSKQILAELEVFNMVALRFLIAFAACLAVFHKRYSRLDKETFLHSGVLGTFLFVSYLCMVLGCKYTTASNAGFMMSLVAFFTPLIILVQERVVPGRVQIASIIITLVGVGLMCLSPGFSLNRGDLICVMSAFFYSFQIPQIGKEFDLLKFTDKLCLNIELKSVSVPEEQILEQLLKNRHYLGHLGKRLRLYSVVTDTMTCYKLSLNDELIPVEFDEIVSSVKRISDDYSDTIDNLFRASDYLVSPSNGEVLYQYESKSCHQLCTTDHREVDLSDFNTQILISYLDKTHEHPIDVGASIDYMQACGIHINFPESPDQEIELSMMEYGGIFYLQSSVFGLFFMVPFGKPDKKGEAHIDPQTLLMEFVNQARAYLKINPAYNFHFVSSSVHGLEDLINKEINDYLERPL